MMLYMYRPTLWEIAHCSSFVIFLRVFSCSQFSGKFILENLFFYYLYIYQVKNLLLLAWNVFSKPNLCFKSFSNLLFLIKLFAYLHLKIYKKLIEIATIIYFSLEGRYLYLVFWCYGAIYIIYIGKKYF